MFGSLKRRAENQIFTRMVSNDLAKRIYKIAHLNGEFLLRSGTVSNQYFDKYRFEAEPKLLREIAVQLAPLVPADTDALAGLEMGGIPLATMLSQITGLPTRFVRKEAKAYGTCKLAEGGDIAGLRLLIVEDVVTSGGQIVKSAEQLRARGAIVTHAVCVIDRQATGTENLSAVGITLSSCFTLDELKSE